MLLNAVTLALNNPSNMASKKANKATFMYGGVELSLTKSKTAAAVQYNRGLRPPPEKGKRSATAPPQQIESFELVRSKRGMDVQLDELRAQPEVSVGTHVWNVGEDEETPFIPTGNLYVEFKPGTKAAKQQEIIENMNLSVKETVGPHAFRLAVTPQSPNPIKCVMALQKNKAIAIAEPELLTLPVTNNFMQPGGRFMSTQWHLENKGSSIPIVDIPNAVFGSSHFKPGADAKVRAAWQHIGHLGSKNIKIAVIDTGFDVEHPQLRGDGTKVRTPFNAGNRTPDASPWYQASDGSWGVYSHGTSCAAVAAGALDNQGILGAAPNARIIPIRLDILSDEAIRNAFEHAMLNGADIISCSLGFPRPVPLSTFVSNYLARVAREGRGGKGIPMFFAAGNANPASNNMPRLISDFAAHPDSICVTASNSLDEPSDYSFYGPNAFICAPTNGNDGVGITTATVDVGPDGRSLAHQYTSGFGGTSSATPLAAGVCALMLSVNPNLTVAQIRGILRQSADRIGGGYNANGHSQQLGYGRINALKAVQMAGGGSGTAAPTPQQPTQQPTPQPPVTPRPTPQPGLAGLQGRVTSKFLNVRNGPSTTNVKVAELQQGAVVSLLEQLPGWWRIGDGQFVNADYIQVISNAGAATRQGRIVNTPTVNVRNGPSTSNALVGTLRQGETVSIFETSRDGWHRIGTGRWVIGKYVQVV
jgi:hypothetical protein